MKPEAYLKYYLETYLINKEEFKQSVVDIIGYPEIKQEIKHFDYFLNKVYDYITNTNEMFFFGYKKELNENVQRFLGAEFEKVIIELDKKYPENFFLTNIYDLYPNMKLELPMDLKPLQLLEKLMLVREIEYMKDKDLDFVIKRVEQLSLELGQKTFKGLISEHFNSQEQILLPQGKRVIIKEDEWLNTINALFPDVELARKPHSFDMMITNEAGISFYELKNLFLNPRDPISYFQGVNVPSIINRQEIFCKETNTSGYLYMTNTATLEKVVLPLSDIAYLMKNNDNRITFNMLKEYAQQNFPNAYKQEKMKKDICLDPSLPEFFETTMKLFQKNVDSELLLMRMNTTDREDFGNAIDAKIIESISSREDLFNLFMDKNSTYIKKEYHPIMEERFNLFVPKTLDFDDKEEVNRTFQQLKDCLNKTLDLSGRSIIHLDKTIKEKDYRYRTIVMTLQELNVPVDIVYGKKFNQFLEDLSNQFTLDDVKRNIPEGSDGKDALRRLRPYINKEQKEIQSPLEEISRFKDM